MANHEGETQTDLCICPTATESLGRLHGIGMGKAIVRTATVKGCPVHDSCRGYTKEARSAAANGPWLYCPHHGVKECPADALAGVDDQP